MARIARAVAPGFPHHVVQRGNNKEDIFFSKEDREKYLLLLKKYADRWRAPILAYCLMENHVHLLTTPKESESLFKMMQGVTLCYTQHINRKYNRTGRLWESRFYSSIVDNEKYLWTVARYIEQNPLRANMVKKASDFQYSSARAHINGMKDEVLRDELFEVEQRKDYIEFLKSNIPLREINNIRLYTRSGRPLGDETFLKKMEKKFKKSFEFKSAGRPKKKSSI